MKCPVIQADDTGETSFGVRETPDHEASFGPPPNPTGLKIDFGAVESMFAFSVPVGTNVPAHNAPQPYICIVLSGEAEISTSDGDKRIFTLERILFVCAVHMLQLIGQRIAVKIVRIGVAALTQRGEFPATLGDQLVFFLFVIICHWSFTVLVSG